MSLSPPTSRFCVRSAEPADIAAILAIEEDSFQSPWRREVFEKELEIEWSRTQVLIELPDQSTESEDAGRLVAFMVYWIVADELHLLDIAVERDQRRRGLARRLMCELDTVCLEHELTWITLEVRMSNRAAIGLYERDGFKTIHRRKNYYVEEGEDALVMAKVFDPNSIPSHLPKTSDNQDPEAGKGDSQQVLG